MAKKKRQKFPIGKLAKKSSLTGFIILLIFTLFQLVDNFHFPQPVKIPTSDSAVELYSNQTQDDLTLLYQQAIENASESIILVIYGLTDSTIIQALQKKSEAGVPVHIVCDSAATKGISKLIPKAVLVKRTGKGLMHQKILIVDRRLIWIGSANLTPGSLNIHGNLVIGMEHPGLAQILADRAKSMDDEGSAAPLLHQETTAGPQQLELWVLPDDTTAVKRLIRLFRSAKKSIKIAMFTWTRIDLTQELLAAAKRGVKVEAVIDHQSGMGSSAKIVHMLEKGGISVGLSTGKGLLHHKFAYIDESILVNGSANWTNAAFKDNDDYFVIVYPLTSQQQAKMNKLCQVIQKESEKPKFSSKNKYTHHE